MRRQTWIGLFVVGLVVLLALPVAAAGVPVIVEPTNLELKGAPAAALAANLRLSVDQEVLKLRASMEDMTCIDEDSQTMPSLSASQIGIEPAFIEKMAAGSSSQIAISLTLPEKTGSCKGSVTFVWGDSVENKLSVPVNLTIATIPVLALQSPEKMTINGWNRSTEFSQPFTLKETAGGSPITDLQAVAGTFSNAEWKTLPEGEIVKPILDTTILGGQTLSGKVNFNLANVPAGTYEGQLLFKSGEKFLAALPVVINVRHPWLPAAAVLAVGVLLGLWLSFYKTMGRPRDQLTKQIAEVKKQRDSDQQLSAFFGPSLEPIIAKAETLLRDKKYSEGLTEIEKASEGIRRWESFGPENWQAQLKYLKENLIPRLQALATPFGKHLLEKANALLKKAGGQDSPESLKTAVSALEKWLFLWNNLLQRLDALSVLLTNLPAGTPAVIKFGFETRVGDLRSRLDALTSESTEAAWVDMDQDIQALVKEINDYIQSHAQPETIRIFSDWSKSWNALRMTRPGAPPELKPVLPVTPRQGRAAQRRLTFWTVFAYALGGALLAIAGFSTLYLSSQTFGAHPVVDYPGLLMWGFTGQAGFTTIADLVRGLGLPAFLKG